MEELHAILSQIKPCDTNAPYIFISYSSADKERVWQDVLAFQKRGYNIWLDEKNLDKTKPSWKQDALAAIEDMDCALVLFYVSATSLCSKACFQELQQTMTEAARAQHLFEPVKFIAIDAAEINDIVTFSKQIAQKLSRDTALGKPEKKQRMLQLSQFVQTFFNSNNERVRIHPKDEHNRKRDYYEEILASFPEETRLVANANTIPENVNVETIFQNATLEKDIPLNAVLPEENPDYVQCKQRIQAALQAAGAFSVTKKPTEPKPEWIVRVPFGKKELEQMQKTAKYGLYHITNHYTEIESQNPFSDNGDIKTLILPDTITTLHEREFMDCCSLSHVLLPALLEKIPQGLFENCINLKKIRIPGNVERIGIDAFWNCISLYDIKFSEILKKIGISAFGYCEKLNAVAIPEGVMEIGWYAFEHCQSLQYIYLPSTLSDIGEGCFMECTSLKEIIIPGGASCLEYGVFYGCTALNRIFLESGVQKISKVFTHAFKNSTNPNSLDHPVHMWIPDTVHEIDYNERYPQYLTIHCSPNSYAHQFANEYEIPFILESNMRMGTHK